MNELRYKIYADEMQGWLFTKNGTDSPRYAIGGLHYSSEHSLKTCANMKIGDTVRINGYLLKRVQ